MVEDPVITRAAELIDTHQIQQAAYLLSSFLQKDPLSPESIPAWLLMTRVVDSSDKQVDCLQRVLQIDPANATALEMLRQLKGEQPFIAGSVEEIGPESGTPAVATPAPGEAPLIGQVESPPETSEVNPPAPAGDEYTPPPLTEIPPEVRHAADQVHAIGEYFEQINPVDEKYQGTAGPDYQGLERIIREQLAAGFILQTEDYTPQKMFGKPEIKFTFARPKAVFKGYCHDYPYVCTKYSTQDNKIGYYLDTLLGEHVAYVDRSIGERKPGLELLSVFTPDHNLLRYLAVIREKDEAHVTIDLYQGSQARKIGEILRDARQKSEVVNDIDGKPMLHLVDRSLTDLKRVVFTIRKETSLLRYQSRAFDYSTRDMLFRVGDPLRLSMDEEAVILMTGLLAVDYMV